MWQNSKLDQCDLVKKVFVRCSRSSLIGIAFKNSIIGGPILYRKLEIFPTNSHTVCCLLPVRYSLGSSNYTSRPPTGVDLALGLGGYDKVGNNDFPAHKQRPPSTLQPLKDEDEEMKRRVASLDSQAGINISNKI